MIQYYHHDKPLLLESGEEIRDLVIAYHVFGTPAPDGSNVVWVCHALTANSDVSDWWPHTVEEGRFLDPNLHCIVCANVLGSCYGTTGPLSVNSATGKPWFRSFPKITIRDVVSCHRILAKALGFKRMHAIVGSSVGGFQALEWAVEEPDRFGRIALIATDAYASPWTIAIDETQRMSITSDITFFDDVPEGGARGLAAARALGLLTYRGGEGYNRTQQDAPHPDDELPEVHRACTYQRYQGEKLVRRFDAYSYTAILDSFDTHDVGRGRGGRAAALSRLTMPVIVVNITTDIIFTEPEMRQLASMIPSAEFVQIESPFGHDGFLVEADLLNSILYPFINGK